MPYIAEADWEEFNRLHALYKREEVWKSVSGVETLEQDIDEPIKVCVMALALLGCEPLWSCCGFDYKGQPIHKSHQYGRCYFILGNLRKAFAMFGTFLVSDMPNKGFWTLQSAGNEHVDFHAEVHNIIPQWDTPNSIHYYETLSMRIQELENFLMGLRDEFSDEAVITDTNAIFGKSVRSWQYPPKQDWVIRKKDLFPE